MKVKENCKSIIADKSSCKNDSDSIEIELLIDEGSDSDTKTRNPIKKVASNIKSKALSIKDSDMFKSIDSLQEENPDTIFYYYRNIYERHQLKRRRNKTTWLPFRKYFFYSNINNVNYSANTAEQKKQDFVIAQNGKPVAEINEIDPNTLSVTIAGNNLGYLKRTRKEKGAEIFEFGNAEIRNRWTGQISIITSDGQTIASLNKFGPRKLFKCLKQTNEVLMIALVLGIDAFQNIRIRNANPYAPYEVEYYDIGGGGGDFGGDSE